MKKITEEKIAEIKNKASKPTIYNGSFPLNEISDREFETMCYLIFKERIKYNDKDLAGKFDSINLMSGIGEKGFDSTLYSKGEINGLIQCKKYKTRLTKPQMLNEFLKFVLYSIVNPELIPDKNNFTYFIIPSSGFANTTLTFISDFNRNILKEDIKSLCLEIIPKYVGLKNINLIDELGNIEDLLKNINVNKMIPEDLNLYLKDYNNIAKTFFRIYTATDNTLIENVVTTYLEPLLKGVKEKTISITDYQFRFKEYLSQVLNRYSSAQTLVFGNQQKRIEDFYYPLTLTCKKESDKQLKIKTQKYTEDFIPKFKKVLICDHGGMGKSTILKWLFRSATIQNKGIPIFIELRSLNNKNTIIDEITNQLQPIDKELEKTLTRDLIAKGGFIFFLDGYDEISKNNKKDVTRDLSNFISKANGNLFIMSSRPEDALKTFGDFQEFSIDRLTEDEAYELIKKIGNNNVKSLQLVEQLKSDKRKELTEFLQSPLLISLLYKKFEHRETIPIQKQEFYWEVYEALFQAHDIIKGDRFERDKESGLTLHEFHKILRGLAYFTVLLNQIEFNHTELERFLRKSNDFFPGIKFEPNSFICDIINNVPIFQKEGLKYKWSHKTLQEYFASEFICRDTKENQGKILERLFNEENSASYYGVFDMCYEIDFKSFRKYVLYPKCKEYSTYYSEFIDPYKGDENFNLIVCIANQLFDSRIAFFNPEADIIKNLIENFDKLKPSLEKHFNFAVRSIEIIISIDKTEDSQVGITMLKINKGFPLKRLLSNKKSKLLKKEKIVLKKHAPLKISYDTKIEDVEFYFLPHNMKDFLEKHSMELEAFSLKFSDNIYNITNCLKLIDEVERESKKEDDVNFFFQGLD